MIVFSSHKLESPLYALPVGLPYLPHTCLPSKLYLQVPAGDPRRPFLRTLCGSTPQSIRCMCKPHNSLISLEESTMQLIQIPLSMMSVQ